MESTVIREEVQAFLQVCQGFAGFAQHDGLTTAEREAIANVVRTLGIGLQAVPGRPALGGTPRSLASDRLTK